MLLSGKRLIGNNLFFPQDNDPKHTLKLCKNHVEKNIKTRALQYIDQEISLSCG